MEVIEIHKGYSSDGKYMVSHEDGRKSLLRVFEWDQLESKRHEYEVLQKMENYQVKCSRPVAFGTLETVQKGYMLVTYIEGNDAEIELPTYSEAEQFRIGVEAGKELAKMHQYRAPAHIPPWYDRKVIKHKRYLEEYATYGVAVENDKKIMSFIEENIGLMKGRPNLFQHDDFHVGNLILKEKSLSGIIDFNRYDWGDPVHEFLKVGMFSSEVSVPFSIGQIAGYHNGKQPDDLFWRLYSLYLAMCVFSSVVWIQKVKPEELDQMMNKIYRVLEDHDCFEKDKPGWYE